MRSALPPFLLATLAAFSSGCSGKLPGEGGGTTAPGASSLPPSALFTASTPTTGPAPLSVTFQQLDPNHTTSWQWDFGDGQSCASHVEPGGAIMGTCGTSPDAPVHVYATPGVYTVSLLASGPGGQRTEIHEDMIEVHTPAPHVDFTGTPQSGLLHLDVEFTRVTDHSSSYLWDWGDGATSTSSETTVHHVYVQPGDFTVTLSATGPGGTTTLPKPNYIHGIAPAPDPSFTVTLGGTTGLHVEATTIPQTVTFQQTEFEYTTNRLWNFGDGSSAPGTGPTITHTYTSFGEFDVTLQATGPGGTETNTDAMAVQLYKPIGDGSFESSTPGQPPSSAWTSFAGNLGGDPHHVVESDVLDQGMPTAGHRWCAIDSVSTYNTTPPGNPCGPSNPSPCGPTTPAVGAAGISQTFTFRTNFTRLKFETVFLCFEDFFTSLSHDDWMSVDVRDDVTMTTRNVFFSAPSLGLPSGSSTLFPGTNLVHPRTTSSVDLVDLFPGSTTHTVFTLTAQVGNAGTNGLSGGSSKGYLDDVRLELSQGGVTALFHGTPVNVYVGDTVQFSDDSLGNPTAWQWTMSDGSETHTSTQQNPAPMFIAPGRKDVRLTASKTGSSDSLLQPRYVQVFSPPHATFNGRADCPIPATLCGTDCCTRAPISWHFTNTSGNPSGLAYQYTWNFDDGSPVSHAEIAVDHVFDHAGTFMVTLTVSTPTTHPAVVSAPMPVYIDAPATFTQVRASPLSAATCGGCHNAGVSTCSNPCGGTGTNGHFNPNTTDSALLLCQLLNCTCGTSAHYVVAGNATSSLIFQAITRMSGTCSGAMPPSATSALSADQVDIVRSWIQSGAPNN